jgi:hypothetical protein
LADCNDNILIRCTGRTGDGGVVVNGLNYGSLGRENADPVVVGLEEVWRKLPEELGRELRHQPDIGVQQSYELVDSFLNAGVSIDRFELTLVEIL